MDTQQAKFEAWRQQVAAMKPDEQVEAVKAEMMKRNPKFDGATMRGAVENGVVVRLDFLSNEVTDLAPVRALPGLKTLNCYASNGKGRLSDLSPLKGMQLNNFSCSWTQVIDLTPLIGMPLDGLGCQGTQVTDLSPLKNIPLTSLHCTGSPVSDLSPLKNMRLTRLLCDKTRITDLSVLKNMPLKELRATSTRTATPTFSRSLKTLETINDKPAADFWKEFEAPAPPKP